MKNKSLKPVDYALFTVCAVLMLGFSVPGYSEVSGTALMLQMSPVEGGSLNISTGVHLYERDAEISLTAVPRTGYQFVCWQGSVSDAASNSTTIVLDSPKIVIAVFEKAKFQTIDATEDIQVSAGQGGGLARSASEGDTGLEQATGGIRPNWQWPHYRWPRNVPVPGEGGNNDNTVPVPPDNEVPEPATAAFMGAGMFLLSVLRRKRAK